LLPLHSAKEHGAIISSDGSDSMKDRKALREEAVSISS